MATMATAARAVAEAFGLPDTDYVSTEVVAQALRRSERAVRDLAVADNHQVETRGRLRWKRVRSEKGQQEKVWLTADVLRVAQERGLVAAPVAMVPAPAAGEPAAAMPIDALMARLLPQAPWQKPLLTVQEAAEMLGLPEQSVLRVVRTGVLPAVLTHVRGDRHRIRRKDVEALKERIENGSDWAV